MPPAPAPIFTHLTPALTFSDKEIDSIFNVGDMFKPDEVDIDSFLETASELELPQLEQPPPAQIQQQHQQQKQQQPIDFGSARFSGATVTFDFKCCTTLSDNCSVWSPLHSQGYLPYSQPPAWYAEVSDGIITGLGGRCVSLFWKKQQRTAG